MKTLKCPKCNSKDLGKIGRNLYFCRDCLCEVKFDKNKIIIYELNEEGFIEKKYNIFNLKYIS